MITFIGNLSYSALAIVYIAYAHNVEYDIYSWSGYSSGHRRSVVLNSRSL